MSVGWCSELGSFKSSVFCLLIILSVSTIPAYERMASAKCFVEFLLGVVDSEGDYRVIRILFIPIPADMVDGFIEVPTYRFGSIQSERGIPKNLPFAQRVNLSCQIGNRSARCVDSAGVSSVRQVELIVLNDFIVSRRSFGYSNVHSIRTEPIVGIGYFVNKTTVF